MKNFLAHFSEFRILYFWTKCCKWCHSLVCSTHYYYHLSSCRRLALHSCPSWRLATTCWCLRASERANADAWKERHAARPRGRRTYVRVRIDPADWLASIKPTVEVSAFFWIFVTELYREFRCVEITAEDGYCSWNTLHSTYEGRGGEFSCN